MVSAAQRQVRLHLATILWPAFLMAGVLEMLVFAFVDPSTLRWMGGEVIAVSPSAVYTLAFVAFWAVITVAGLMTRLLAGDPRHINQEGASGAFRH